MLVQAVKRGLIDDTGIAMTCVELRINGISLCLRTVIAQETGKCRGSFDYIIDVNLDVDGFGDLITDGSFWNHIRDLNLELKVRPRFACKSFIIRIDLEIQQTC